VILAGGDSRKAGKENILFRQSGKDDGRGLHSSTFQLNLSAFYGIGGALRGCVARARVEGLTGGVQGVQGVFVCQTRLKLS